MVKSILVPTLCVVSLAAALVACGGGRAAKPVDLDPLVAVVVDDEHQPPVTESSHGNDLLILTPSAENLQSGEIALMVDGLAISRREYAAGLQKFIEENPNVEDPAVAYRRKLRDELLLLAYVRDELAMQEEDFRNRARAELRETIAALVMERIIDSRITVSEEEIRARYERDRQMWVQPPRVIVELILVATHAEAQALIQRIEAGENFGELARVFSLHSSSQREGRLEPFRRGTYNAALEDVAFALRPGEMGTAETERGIFILRKIADSSETVTPLSEVRAQIAETIRLEKENAERDAFMQDLNDRYPTTFQPAKSAQP